jgi:hypothetical protein
MVLLRGPLDCPQPPQAATEVKNGQITNYLNKLPPKGVNKEHLTTTGLEKLIALKASLNLGLSNELKTAFPKVVPVNRPIVPNQNIPDPM